MKLITWNINGIRAVLKKCLLDYLKKEDADVFSFQEIKIAEAARLKEGLKFSDYQEFWNSAERPGY